MRRNWISGVRAGALVGLIGLSGLIGAPMAQANNVTNDIVLLGGSNFFGAVHTDDLDFTDTFNFAIDGVLSANVSLVTIGADASNIDFVSADLNGVALALSANGFFETGSLGNTDLTGPLVLTVRGRSGATGGTFASYSGTINVTIIPEPSTALLMSFGLLGLGLVARRTRV